MKHGCEKIKTVPESGTRLGQLIADVRLEYPHYNAHQVLELLAERGDIVRCSCGGAWVRTPHRRMPI